MIRLRLLHPLRWAIALLVIYWIVLFIGTHTPQMPRLRLPNNSDKAAHFLGYAGLAFLTAAVALRRSRWSRGAALGLLAGLMAYGLIDEFLQIPIPGRSADVWDWVADSLGAATGIGIFRLVQKTAQTRREHRRRLDEMALERV